jgi:hypothetical protein
MGESHYWRRGVVDIVLLDLGALPSSWASSSFAAAGGRCLAAGINWRKAAVENRGGGGGCRAPLRLAILLLVAQLLL